MIWPEIVWHENGLFLADSFTTSSFDDWSRATAGNLTAIERVMNHRHMRNALQSLDDAPWSVLVSAGALFRECWEARLKQLYPQTPTQVDVFHSDCDVEGTFFVVRT